MTIRTPKLSALRRELGENAWPASVIAPWVGASSPQMILASVLLPAPFSPVRASTSPGCKFKLTSCKTGMT